MIKEIRNCKDCPFSSPDDDTESSQMVCWEIVRQGIEWKDKDGFDDMYYDGKVPSVCPLRTAPIIIRLNEELDISERG